MALINDGKMINPEENTGKPPEEPVKEVKPRARKLNSPVGPFKTTTTFYEKGKDRTIEINSINAKGAWYRLQGQSDCYFLPHEVALQKAMSIKAGFDTGPRGGSLKRGEQHLPQ